MKYYAKRLRLQKPSALHCDFVHAGHNRVRADEHGVLCGRISGRVARIECSCRHLRQPFLRRYGVDYADPRRFLLLRNCQRRYADLIKVLLFTFRLTSGVFTINIRELVGYSSSPDARTTCRGYSVS